MFKKIIITFLIFVNFYSFCFASNCKIKEGPSPQLENYLKNNRNIIKNITKQIIKSDKIPKKSIKKNFLAMFNQLINWDGYSSYFEYMVLFPIFNDVTKEAIRDYNILEKEGEGLIKFYKKTVEKGYQNFEIIDVCNGVENDCNLSGNSQQILKKLIKNHNKIINIYRLVVMGKQIQEKDSLILVEKDFIKNLKKDYSPESSCSSAKGSFFKTIKEEIKKIQLLNENALNGIKDFNEALDLIKQHSSGKKLSEKEQKREKDLLIEELKRQGISGDKADAIIKNLEKFNKEGFRGVAKNNFLTNSFSFVLNQVNQQYQNFKKDIFPEKKEKKEKTKNKTIKSTLKIFEKIDVDKEISISIKKLYTKEIPFTKIADENMVKLRTDLINLHQNLNTSINILRKTCPYAKKTCEEQDRSLGNCGNCNF